MFKMKTWMLKIKLDFWRRFNAIVMALDEDGFLLAAFRKV